MPPHWPIPFARVETLFLDAGNTLVSIDFEWVCEELRERDVPCDPDALCRAEAAARPAVSQAVARRGTGTEGRDAFSFYLDSVLACLGAAGERRSTLVTELVPVLRSRGTQRLWSRVMPGVPEALAALRSLGLRLVVVSNSDGTVEQGLVDQGLRPLVDEVVDSHVVGFEKPDPRIFHSALELAGSDPARTLHVGDLYAADVVGARAAGVHALLLDPFDDWAGVDCERSPDVGQLAERLRAERGR